MRGRIKCQVPGVAYGISSKSMYSPSSFLKILPLRRWRELPLECAVLAPWFCALPVWRLLRPLSLRGVMPRNELMVRTRVCAMLNRKMKKPKIRAKRQPNPVCISLIIMVCYLLKCKGHANYCFPAFATALLTKEQTM